MRDGASQPIIADMLTTGSPLMDAERAFARETRRRRRSALARALRRRPAESGRLHVFDARALACSGGAVGRDVREIPLCKIDGTLEPSRAAMFDASFRPSGAAGRRWQSIWRAEATGALLPPISVVRVGDRFAVRDGHHRVSVALARGATTIDAEVYGAQL